MSGYHDDSESPPVSCYGYANCEHTGYCDDECHYAIDKHFAAARLANLGAGLAVAGVLTAIRAALAYDLSDLPLQGRLSGGEYTVEAWSRLWNTNMRAWKIVALGVGR